MELFFIETKLVVTQTHNFFYCFELRIATYIHVQHLSCVFYLLHFFTNMKSSSSLKKNNAFLFFASGFVFHLCCVYFMLAVFVFDFGVQCDSFYFVFVFVFIGCVFAMNTPICQNGFVYY